MADENPARKIEEAAYGVHRRVTGLIGCDGEAVLTDRGVPRGWFIARRADTEGLRT